MELVKKEADTSTLLHAQRRCVHGAAVGMNT